jgi:hypothetical protein
MERMTSVLRRRGMTNRSRMFGLAAAGLLCAVLAGCGTAVATSTADSAPPATTPAASGAGGAALATAAATETGCAGVSQATSVVIARHLLVAQPVNGRLYAQRHASLVRALFGEFCAALDHPDLPQTPLHCPIDIGTTYTGTFYAGQRVLATFVYVPTGCQRLSLTASGKTRATFMIGTAAAAAPHLKADLAAVLGLPQSQVDGSAGPATVGSGMGSR